MRKRFSYLVFHFSSGLQHRIERRLTKAGMLAAAGLVACAVVGADTNQTMAFQGFTFLLALLAISVGSSALFRGHFGVRRLLPRFGTAGEPLSYGIQVQNRTGKPQAGLIVQENLADPRPSMEEWSGAVAPRHERHNRWDRAIGYPAWMCLVSRNRRGVVREQPLPALPANGVVEARLELLPLSRGRLEFTGVTVARPDPLGLVNALRTVPAPQSFLVLPKRYPVRDLQLPGSRRYQQGGVPLASSVGDSDEFVSLREYRPGDPLRHIHWKSWARVGKPVVKEYQDEFFVRHALVLDTFPKTAESELFEEAVTVAASFVCAIPTQESLLDLMFVGPEASCFTAGRGLAHTEKMLEVLACVQPCRDKPFRTLHDSVLARGASLSGCICVLLAWDEERQDLVGRLGALGVPTLTIVITEAAAASPPRSSGKVEGPIHRLEVGKIAEGLARL